MAFLSGYEGPGQRIEAHVRRESRGMVHRPHREVGALARDEASAIGEP